MRIEDLQTPCLLVDLDILEQNIRTMADYCAGQKIGLRPHVKGIKNPLLAKKQLEAGAIGLACQTMEEVEAMALNGLGPILLTHGLASGDAVERFLNLSKHVQMMVTVDGLESAELLGRAALHRNQVAGVVVEVNVGQNRTGVEPGEEAAELAVAVSRIGGLKFRGLMGYEGHLQVSIPEFEKRRAEDRLALGKLGQSVEAVKRKGLEVEMVSSGGTGTYNIAPEFGVATEIQPGSYVMMDHRYNRVQTCGTDFGNALTILTTVVSTPNLKQAVVDLGWKGCGVEYSIFGWDGLPKPMLDGVTYGLAGDEHGILKVDDASVRPRFGDKVRFVPSHCDTTLNLYGRFYGVRRGEVEIVLPVARR